MRKVDFFRSVSYRYRTTNFDYLFLNKRDYKRFESLHLSKLKDLEAFLLDAYNEIFVLALQTKLTRDAEFLSNQHVVRCHVRPGQYEANLLRCLNLSISILKRTGKRKRLLVKLERLYTHCFETPIQIYTVSKMFIKAH